MTLLSQNLFGLVLHEKYFSRNIQLIFSISLKSRQVFQENTAFDLVNSIGLGELVWPGVGLSICLVF